MSHATSLCGSILLTLALSATGLADQTPPRNASATPAPLISAIDAKHLGYHVAWSADLSLPSGATITRAAILDSLLVVVDRQNIVTAISMSDGSVQWATPVGDPALHTLFTPARWDDRIIVSSEVELVHLESSSGRLLERQRLASSVTDGPAVVDYIACFGGIDGRLFGHDLRAGYARWAFDMGGQIRARPTAVGNDFFAATTTGFFGMFTREGERLWHGRALDRIDAPAAALRNLILIPSHDHALYAVLRATGRDVWVFRSTQPIEEAPVMIGPTTAVIPADRQGGALAIDTASGKEVWRLPEAGDLVPASDGKVLRNFGNELFLIDLATTRPLARASVRGVEWIMQGPEGVRLLLTPRGRIVRLNPGL